MGKTVITHFTSGDPKGVQYAFIKNKTCQMYSIPRSEIDYLNKDQALQKPAFYILLGESPSHTPQAYIGETENFRERVKSHENKKAFWHKALVFISKDGDMTKVDVQYLEYKAITQAKAVGTYLLTENKQTPKAPNLPAHQRDSVEEFFEDVQFLSSFSGCNIFEESTISTDHHYFYLNKRGGRAKGFYDASGFTLLKGSILVSGFVPSYKDGEKRNKFLKKYTSVTAEGLSLKADYRFNSPSTAANYCLGRQCNGWVEWRDEEGKTLDEVYRTPLEDD